jgi:hypothetical protein
MATVVTNQPSDTGSTNAGYFLALAVIVLLVLAFIFYGLPNLGLGGGAANTGSSVSLPSEVNVNTK